MRCLLLAALAGCASSGPLPCNGAVELCDRPLDEVALPATHNAMSNADDGWWGPNQLHGPARQLEDGVRGMLIDTHWWQDDAWLCHEFCELGATPLVDVLADVDAFLAANPREVLVLVVQDGLTTEQTEDAFRASGLFDRVVVPPAEGEPWPTLGELVADGGRVVVSRESGGQDAAWYPSFYDQLGFDTPYDFSDPSEFTCEVLRGDPAHRLFLVNHWISDPLTDRDAAAVVNQADVLGERVRACADRWGRIPSLVAVDDYDLGDLFEVVRELNGLP